MSTRSYSSPLVVLAMLIALACPRGAVAQVDINSFPGDAPGEKASFQFADYVIVSPQQVQGQKVEIPIPLGAGLTIETVTVRAFVFSIGDVLPEVSLFTVIGERNAADKHTIALTRKGVATGIVVYEATHGARLRHRADTTRPHFQVRRMAADGVGGNVAFRVTVAGYVTVAPSR